MRLPWKKLKPAAPGAKHVEIWGHFEAVHRFHKRLVIAAVMWSFLALAGGAYGMYSALNRPLVIAIDPQGRARDMGPVENNVAPLDVEVRYVAKTFLRTSMAFHSDTIEADLAHAFNFMTDGLRTKMAAEFDEYKQGRGLSFVDFVKRQHIRTTLEFRTVETQSHNDRLWTVVLRGSAKTWPLNRVGEDAAVRERLFEAQLTLVRAPRTEMTPNGLLVDRQATRFFEPDDGPALQEERVTGEATP